jgi:hypothetical protein
LEDRLVPSVASLFDADAESWSLQGDANGGSGIPTYHATGGHPGGYVSATDDVQGQPFYFLAPDKFLGDQSATYGKVLAYDMKQDHTDKQLNRADDVALIGNGLTLTHNTANPGLAWTPYRVRLTETGWINHDTGDPATRDELLTVLSGLTKLKILGEHRDGSETDSIDDVVLYSQTGLLVNSTAAGLQDRPRVASDAAGDSVVVWESDGQDGDGLGIFAQRFNSAGVPQGNEFQVNTTTAGTQESPAVAMDASGNFVVAWDGNGPGDSQGIFAQRYSSTGVAQGGEFRVNSTAADLQLAPAVAADALGNFVVTWETFDSTTGWNINGRRFFADGTPVGEFPINTTKGGDQTANAVAMTGAGSFVVVWESDQLSSADVFLQRYNASGMPVGTESRVNASTTGDQVMPRVAIAANGTFTVVWDGPDGDGEGVFARRFTAQGGAPGGEGRVNFTRTKDQTNADVTMDAAGNFLVVWDGNGPGDRDGVFAQRFSATGVRQGGEVLTNAATLGSQEAPAAAMNAVGDALVVWAGRGPGDLQGVFAALYLLPRVSVSDASVTEGDSGSQDLTFTVTLDQPGAWPTTVNWATTSGTAKAAEDYVSAHGTLRFALEETAKTITVQVLGDLLNEADETFSVKLTKPLNAVLADAIGIGTIIDNDPAPSISVNDVAILEGNSGTSFLTFTVSLSAASGQTVKVDYATADGKATAGSDYSAKSGTLTFAPGQTSMTVSIAIKGDTLVEADETFFLNLSHALSATLADAQGVGTILNDD